jgi:hypothetical protein
MNKRQNHISDFATRVKAQYPRWLVHLSLLLQNIVMKTNCHSDGNLIRNSGEFYSISNYIINNPRNWKDDKFY